MRLKIDLSACVGHGRCYAEAPQLVDADDEGHGVVVVDEVPEYMQATARMAAESCPERAVHIE